jgi:RHS repeat-associated protein
MMVNASGAIEDDFDWYPFGEAEYYKLNSGTLYFFAGYEIDFETDDYHTQARQLIPTLGRWAQPDPYLGSYDFANPQSLNRYAYARNNPLRFIDPSGRDGCSPDTNARLGPVHALDEENCDNQGNGGGGDNSNGGSASTDSGYTIQVYVDLFSSTLSDALQVVTDTWDIGGGYFFGWQLASGIVAPNNPTAPCNQSRANGKALDYSQPIHKGGLTTMQHIQSRHMPGVGKKNVSTYWTQDWSAVGKMNYWTFFLGTQSIDRGSVVFDFTFPNLMGWLAPGSGLQNGIGYDANGNDTLTNHLVVMPDCKTVVTSYPIE